jgi:hypothetical protein
MKSQLELGVAIHRVTVKSTEQGRERINGDWEGTIIRDKGEMTVPGRGTLCANAEMDRSIGSRKCKSKVARHAEADNNS